MAARTGIPYALSTMGTTSIEGWPTAAPGARRWFQLYLWRDRAASRDLVARARAAGYEALVLTVDTPVAGPRLRDVRNGLTLPPSLSAAHVRRGGRCTRRGGSTCSPPSRWSSPRCTGSSGTVAELVGPHVRPGRDRWPTWPGCARPGPDRWWSRASRPSTTPARWSTPAPTRSSSPTTAAASSTARRRRWSGCPAVVDAVGDRAEVYVDGGILSGGDVVAAVALGARAVLVGRAYLYGLMAGGERGVQRAADILAGGGRRHAGAARRHPGRRPLARTRPAARR